ncbi:class I SAM-dependent DNA methyltransferase [Rhizobium deserti]|uniref:site-specific DNA-methyltransferase (adenine-specific) n=2 Tax=Rhizobium deserti TaxID=2547961 RepID=A0A4R5ULB7_9HYPH|nr:class I SAM-dependent DNA methyltransferase [Rhizobium deserti]
MLAARKQAEDYARALPVEHGYPPFLLVVDVGHVIEVYADFSGQGKNYAHFPDRQSYRIGSDDLRDPKVQARLKAIWDNPSLLDPTRISAEVTKDIAERLAKIAKRLEGRYDAKDVAEFLMRCLFTMFAEDVELIPEKGFHKLLGKMKDTPENFVPALESLWEAMDLGHYAPNLNAVMRRFNGGLFKKRAALPLDREDIVELWVAAGKNWSQVEPAIFGTLLERALNPRERSKLGAHYTPRTYVERLVIPTIIEPLRADWELVQGQVKELRDKGDNVGALAAAKAYHHKLCTTRVLDPACGTGNFLYVSLELMKRLEGEVLEALDDLGEDQRRFAMEGETVSPRQFYGLELNPRAVPIADLVLWIGYLKWQLRTSGLTSITDPVLHAYGTIVQQDAVIAYQAREVDRDGSGEPIRIWDGTSHVSSPVTGQLVPDQTARMETYRYRNPTSAAWPEVEFIVGNPPFIGNKLLRRRLGNGYVDALYAAYADMPNSYDFVTYWWAKAANLLQEGAIRRFGFVTTKTIAQVSNRKVLKDLTASGKFGILFAVPNHPWFNDADTAAVRVAFTVAGAAGPPSVLSLVKSEKRNKRGEAPSVDLETRTGTINSDLTTGIDATDAKELLANSQLSFQGCKLGHDNFQIAEAHSLLRTYRGELPVLRKYIGGDQIKDGAEPNYVIDFFGLSESAARETAPAAYQHLLDHVKPHKDEVRRASHRNRWWLFGEPRPELRDALQGQTRYLATVEVSKHRYFVPVTWPDVLVDGSVIAIALGEPANSAVLHSRLHCVWALRLGGRMGAGNDPRYQNSLVFDRFPFPLSVDPKLMPSHPLFAQRERLRELGEGLHAFRRQRLAEHPFLTMTSMYNVLERIRELDNGCDVPPLTDVERDLHQAGLISVLKDIHDNIDRAVLSAYGCEDLIPELVGKPGATVPSPHKEETQEQAEQELLTRLVALNRERAAEEKRGVVRWLRPDYQIPKLGGKASSDDEHVGMLDVQLPSNGERLRWPSDGLEQIRLVRDLLAKAPAPTPPDAIASVFDGRNTEKRKGRVAEVLETLVATGMARTGDVEGQRRYFLPR